MKKITIIISLLIISLFAYSNIDGGDKTNETNETTIVNPDKKHIEIVYINDITGFKIANKLINRIQAKHPEKFKDVEIRIEFGEEFIESEVEFEDWMSKPFVEDSTEKELALEDWMLVPFSI
jgi:hypothetical protein